MYQLYRLRELGMRVRVFEAGTNVGGKQVTVVGPVYAYLCMGDAVSCEPVSTPNSLLYRDSLKNPRSA